MIENLTWVDACFASGWLLERQVYQRFLVSTSVSPLPKITKKSLIAFSALWGLELLRSWKWVDALRAMIVENSECQY